MRVRRRALAIGAEQPVEPAVAQLDEACRRRLGGPDEHALQLAQRDPLLLLVPSDRIGIAGDVDLEPLALLEQRAPVRVEPGRLGALELTELFAVDIRVEHRKPRLRRAQRHLLAAKRHACGEDRVFERVLLLNKLGCDDAALARLPQAVEPLALVARSRLLRFEQRLDLRTGEQVAVARHDGGLLGDFLLADSDRATLLGTLEVVLLEPRLVVGGVAGGCC